MPEDRLPPRRPSRRAWRVVCLAAGERTRAAMAKAAASCRWDEAARRRHLARHHQAAAERAATTLGELRAGALKLGQMASFLELGAVPKDYRGTYQRQFAMLRDSAPPMPWAMVRGVLEDEWGAPPKSLLDEIDEEAAAAASIGQVHRARLRDGREVAVKVQYPGVAESMEADIRVLGLVLRAISPLTPGLDSRETTAELRQRLLEELDYKREAAHQEAYRQAYEGDPQISIPAVVPELTRPRVLVSEWVDGMRFDAIRALPAADRTRFAEILVRFYLGQVYVVGRLNGDPHPGNYLLRPDGRVVFLDFGAVKVLEPGYLEHQRENILAYLAGDGVRLRESMRRAGFLAAAGVEDVDPGVLMRTLAANDGWLLDDVERHYDVAFARERIRALANRDGDIHYLMRHQRLPAEEIWNRRLLTGLLAVLAQLDVTGNWHRVMRPFWLEETAA
jgi:predicted unusual protein kinase regulating ubiquinone biosynthesis (AarF/ABC1/UbiB family)